MLSDAEAADEICAPRSAAKEALIAAKSALLYAPSGIRRTTSNRYRRKLSSLMAPSPGNTVPADGDVSFS
jgi:hypothetical protein